MKEELEGFEISLKKWQALSKDEKKMLSSLGVRPRPGKGNTQKKTKAKMKVFYLEEYNLGVRQVCTLCGAEDLRVYHMKDSEGVLTKGEELSSGTPHSREVRVEVKHCNQCFIRLTLWDKQELITRLIEERKGG